MIEDTTRGRVVLDERDRSHWLVALPFMFTIIGGALLQKTTGEFAVTPYVGQRLHLDPGLASAAWLLTGVAAVAFVFAAWAWSAGYFRHALVSAVGSLLTLGLLLAGAGGVYQRASLCTIRDCLDSQPYPAAAGDGLLALVSFILAATVMVVVTLYLLQKAVTLQADGVHGRVGQQAHRN
jgi:hypothetical protein